MGTAGGPAIMVSGTITFADRTARDSAVAAAMEIQRATRDDEPGCLAYVFAADPAADTLVHVYEAWADEASLAAHFLHPNYTLMRQLLREFPRGPLRKSPSTRSPARSLSTTATVHPGPTGSEPHPMMNGSPIRGVLGVN